MQTNLGYAAPYIQPPMRCAIYARYSSNLQDPCSIDDQIRECRDAIKAKGWVVAEEWVCSDEALSGQSLLNRTGLDRLLKHAEQKTKEFDVIVADDTSRFARNLSDSLPITDYLKFDGVGLYFVKQQLASWDPHFRDQFIREQRKDEDHSVSTGHRVKRGQKGRVDRGYIGAGRTFGFNNVPVEIPGSRGIYGRPKVEGVKLEVGAEEAAVVLRIYEAKAAGISQLKIVHDFNRQGIPSTLSSNGKGPRTWNVATVSRILQNEKYIGVYIFNKRKQVRNPRTGRKTLVPRPIEEWQIEYWPELRIISNDLWVAVQKELKSASGKLVGRRKGGLNRTEASRHYIFSGLLECGLCRDKINICSGRPPHAVYGCHRHRFKGLCSNPVTISERSLSHQLISYLGGRLRSPEVHTRIVEEFSNQLDGAIKERAKLARQSAEDPSASERQRTELKRQIANCIDTAIAFGPSPVLTDRHEKLKQRLAAIEPRPTIAVRQENYSREQIESFVAKKLSDLEAVLVSDPERAKWEMKKRVTHLVMNPLVTPEGRFFEVSGDLRLFADPDDVMLDGSVHRSEQHYNSFLLPISLRLEACTGIGGPKAA